jgi:hypothetical protein
MGFLETQSVKQLAASFSPLLAVTAFVGAYVYYFSAAGIGDVSASYLQDAGNGVEFFYRILWFVSAVATSLGAVLVAVISARITAELLSTKKQLQLYGVCTGTLALVLLLLHFSDMSGSAGAALLSQIDGAPGGKVDGAVERTMSLAVVAIFLLVVSACAIIAKSQHHFDIASATDLYGKFRVSLVATSVFLVIGTLNIAALYQWAVRVPVDNGVASVVADGLGVGGGVIYSVLLLSIYVPVSFHLNRKVNLLLEEEVSSDDPDDVERWLKRYGLFNSPARVVARYALIAAPMIAGAAIDAVMA